MKLSDDKTSLIKNEPTKITNKLNGCILAGTVEKLSNDYNLVLPK